MKWIVLLIAISSLALTPAEKMLVERLGQINDRQKVELDDANAKLVWTSKELDDIQPKIDQVARERDGFKDYGDSQHEQLVNAQKVLAEEKSSKLKWQVAFGGFALLVGAYFGLKFLTPWGRLIP